MDWPFCLRLVQGALPGFVWELDQPQARRLLAAVALGPREALAVALLEEPEVSAEVLRLRPELLDA